VMNVGPTIVSEPPGGLGWTRGARMLAGDPPAAAG